MKEVFILKKNIFYVLVVIFIIGFIYFFPKQEALTHHKLEIEPVEVLIEGEVNLPGTYIISGGKTLGYLINLAGGLTNYADTTNLNF